MKKGIAALLTLLLLCVNAAAAESVRFSDVAAEDYFAPAVEWAVERGITKGTSATAFSPSAPCTRAQVVTFLWRAGGCPESGTQNAFSDVREGAYYYQPVLWAVERGITNGVTDKFFAPYLDCSRAQILTMLWRAMGEPETSGGGEIASAYESHWAVSALAWAEDNGMLEENKDTFQPNGICPRADVMFYLYQYDARRADREPEGEQPAMYNESILYQAATHDEFASAVSRLIQEYSDKVTVTVQNGEYALGRLIVKANSIPSLQEYHAVRLVKDVDDHYVIQFETDTDAERCADYLRTLPEVEYAEADGLVTADAGGGGGFSVGIV
ncbi:MAG: S-layer homology domain-containing protein [Oscillibacter sp.]|nr:S-layer homology domain-containing protein [Oscillibacter sp.]